MRFTNKFAKVIRVKAIKVQKFKFDMKYTNVGDGDGDGDINSFQFVRKKTERREIICFERKK